MAALPSLNLLGEVFILCSYLIEELFLLYFLMISSFMSCVHSIFYMVKFSMVIFLIFLLIIFVNIFYHLVPLNFLVLKGDSFFICCLNSLKSMMICGVIGVILLEVTFFFYIILDLLFSLVSDVYHFLGMYVF